jgi:hypothetical protein
MDKKPPDWLLPAEALGVVLSTYLPAAAAILLLILTLLRPLLHALPAALYWLGLGTGGIGIILLFFARLPLYRQGRFWTFGPQHLDRSHRRLYWVAYLLVAACILLFLILLFLAT